MALDSVPVFAVEHASVSRISIWSLVLFECCHVGHGAVHGIGHLAKAALLSLQGMRRNCFFFFFFFFFFFVLFVFFVCFFCCCCCCFFFFLSSFSRLERFSTSLERSLTASRTEPRLMDLDARTWFAARMPISRLQTIFRQARMETLVLFTPFRPLPCR
jgi:hypothetical protein